MQFGRRDLLKVAGGAAVNRSLTGGAQAGAKHPNILFLFPDQLRHDFVEQPGVSSPGIPVRTPNVRKLMQEGVWFTRAVTPAPLCAPARACLASGLEYDNCRVPTNAQNYPSDQPTFYQMLRTAGYHVMGCGKFDLHKPELDWGLDGKRKIAEWGFSDGIDNEGKHDATGAWKRAGNKPKGPFMAYLDKIGMAHAHVEDYEKRKGHGETFPTPLSDEAYGDNWIARNGLGLLDAAPKDKPWFLQVNFNGPHNPWDITTSMEKRWRGVKFAQPNRCTELTPANHELVRQNYAAMIGNIDRRVGEFVAKVRDRGELSNTLIVFASDHGEMLGDHNLWAKRHPYHGSVGVPLVVWGQDVKRGLKIDAPSTTLDLTATFLDYAGVTRPAKMDSRSLRPLVTGKTAQGREHVLSGMDDWRLVMQGRYKYFRGFGKEGPMLFDTLADPHENDNLATREPALCSRMEKLLSA
ncbi:MAG: sulfatase-like hydrolase/transferase [Bryobacteraceae bacterium]|nr:sulfatase-like hydrolase/transferase [Bryobacteraceae bacterium]